MRDSKMTPIRIPTDLLQSIDQHVGPRQRSKFIIEAAMRELLRRRQLDAVQAAAGAWNDADHPELSDTVEGLKIYLEQLRTRRETP